MIEACESCHGSCFSPQSSVHKVGRSAGSIFRAVTEIGQQRAPLTNRPAATRVLEPASQDPLCRGHSEGPRHTEPWPYTAMFSGTAGEGSRGAAFTPKVRMLSISMETDGPICSG